MSKSNNLQLFCSDQATKGYRLIPVSDHIQELLLLVFSTAFSPDGFEKRILNLKGGITNLFFTITREMLINVLAMLSNGAALNKI